MLETISRISGDFVRHRISKDVIPKLTRFLHSQGEIRWVNIHMSLVARKLSLAPQIQYCAFLSVSTKIIFLARLSTVFKLYIFSSIKKYLIKHQIY